MYPAPLNPINVHVQLRTASSDWLLDFMKYQILKKSFNI